MNLEPKYPASDSPEDLAAVRRADAYMKRADDLQSMRRRGWAALIAGAFMVVLIVGLWVFILRLLADPTVVPRDPHYADFLGKLFVAFALIILSGLLGIASGAIQIRTGRQSRGLTIAVLVVFLAAFGTVMLAVSGQHS